MEPGMHVWCTDVNGDKAWILGKVIQKNDDKIYLMPVDGTSKNIISRSSSGNGHGNEYDGIEIVNSVSIGVTQDEGRDDDNLISLPHLHEPAILHAISERFFAGEIYTWTGPVLIAVNPFQRLPLYTMEIIEKYRAQGMVGTDGTAAIAPHIFAIADGAFRQMVKSRCTSQSILISGESGAGKTESTKIVMNYLTTLGSAGSAQGRQTVMDRVMQSNPILEAFGNAQTLRNANSSRFGKFIEMGFNHQGCLQGARVQTYLLEKVRLTSHASGERNYHIFYQFLRGASKKQRKMYGLDKYVTQESELPEGFHYTSQGGAPHLREFSDEEGFHQVCKAMKGLGWTETKINSVLSLVVGLLHLGQINFRASEREGVEVAVVDDTNPMHDSARHLGVDADKLEMALTERTTVIRGEAITSTLSAESAIDVRDALAKTLYGALFLWLVDEVNQSILWKTEQEIHSSCGVLDIFGFECFATNSFEQLCINFANEALQQQFNKFIFKLEQAEYEREAIDWTLISFPDNQDCLDMIQMKKTGILAILDDELKLPKACDKNFATRMFKQLLPEHNQLETENSRFSATRFQKSRSVFCVRHFAGIVQYSAETGFVEKNRNEIPVAAKYLFQTAPSKFIRAIYEAVERREETHTLAVSSPTKLRSSKRSNTVGMQFKTQLQSLIQNLEKTEPHYIRCLKPNDESIPNVLARKRLAEQLRCGGVLEAIRVSRMGYPIQLSHAKFFQKFRMLLPFPEKAAAPHNLECTDMRASSVKLLDSILERTPFVQLQQSSSKFTKTDIQIGLTKIFMRKAPYDAMENILAANQRMAAIIMQSIMRGYKCRNRYSLMSVRALMIQKCWRGQIGRKRLRSSQQSAASQLLTTTLRMLLHRRQFSRVKRGISLSQAHYRMNKVRKEYQMLKLATISLQRNMRTLAARRQQGGLVRQHNPKKKIKEVSVKLKEQVSTLTQTLPTKDDLLHIRIAAKVKEMQGEIDRLKKSVIDLQVELQEEKSQRRQLEVDVAKQKLLSTSPTRRYQPFLSSKNLNFANHNNSMAQHKLHVARLAEELEEERSDQRTKPMNEVLESLHDYVALSDIDSISECEHSKVDEQAVMKMVCMFLIMIVLGLLLLCAKVLLRRRSTSRIALFALEQYAEFDTQHWGIIEEALGLYSI